MKIDLKNKEDILNFFSYYIDRESIISFIEEGGHPKISIIHHTYYKIIPLNLLETETSRIEEFTQKTFPVDIVENCWKLLHYFIENEIAFLLDNTETPTFTLNNLEKIITIAIYEDYYIMKKHINKEKEIFWKEIKTFDYLIETLNRLSQK